MSTKLSFKEALARRDAIPADPRVKSDSPTISIALWSTEKIERPVTFIRLLSNYGVSLKRARRVLEHLAKGEVSAVEIPAELANRLLHDLQNLNVFGAVVANPNRVDPKQIRAKQGLSQVEFACLYGLELDTLKNWEQGRNSPDGPATLLLKVIDVCPHAVIEARRADGSIQPRRETPGPGAWVAYQSAKLAKDYLIGHGVIASDSCGTISGSGLTISYRSDPSSYSWGRKAVSK